MTSKKVKKPGFFEQEAWAMLSLIIIPLFAILAAYFFPMLLEKYHSRKRRDIYKDLQVISEAIENYHRLKGIYPPTLNDLGLNSTEDRYSKSGESYIYKIINGKVLLYSRGPDGDDDLGIVKYNRNEGGQSNGDIVWDQKGK